MLALTLPAVGACGGFLGLSGDDGDDPIPTVNPDAALDGSNVGDASGTNDAPAPVDSGDAAVADGGRTERYVFVTSTMSGGNLGGLFGADQRCNQLANLGDAKLIGREFVALLSVGGGGVVTTAAGRLGGSGPPYERLDGTRVADDTAKLLSGPLLAAINITEKGALAGGPSGVWTGTNLGGTATGFDCGGWVEPDGPSGTFGVPSLVDGGGWVNAADGLCEEQRRLYCVERINP